MTTINTASPQDTQDHILGSGALSYEWWLDVKARNLDTPEWVAAVRADDGDGGTKEALVSHESVMRAARYVIANNGMTKRTPRGSEYPAWSADLERECYHLVFRAGEADLDADVADELLQVIVLGEVIYG